jgi:hypothetical protein
MSQIEYFAAVAEFIRGKGIAQSPTARLAPTQGTVAVSDRLALQRRAEWLEALRQRKLRSISNACLPQPGEGARGLR